MNFTEYQIPKEYTNKFKVTPRDKREFKKFWNDELDKLSNMDNISSDTIPEIHKVFMDLFWESKSIAKEKYTPSKYKKNIYVNLSN